MTVWTSSCHTSSPPAAHGHPVAVAATNLIMAVRSGEIVLSDRARRNTAVALTGRVTDADRTLLGALSAILDRDPRTLSIHLQQYARAMARRKSATTTPLKNVVSPHVHGVFALASRAFADAPGASDQLVLPTSGAFSGDFASWQQEGVRAGTFISYEPPLDTIAVILRTPPPQSRLQIGRAHV